MRELVEVAFDDGRSMWVAVEPPEGPRDVGVPRLRVQEVPGFVEAVDWVATRLVAGTRGIRPDRVSAEFGIEVSVGGGGVVAALVGLGGKATVKVTMSWGAGEDPSGPPDADAPPSEGADEPGPAAPDIPS